MSIFSYVIFTVLGLAFTLIGLFFILLIAKNVKQGKVVREQLAQRIESLRMSKMLKAMGLDFSKYLYDVPLSKINNSMNNCENCDSIKQCDEKLQQEVITPEEIDFCPNHECLGQFKELKKSESQHPVTN